MTSIVTVTPASQSVKAGRDGVAEHAFSVTNITGAPLSVGAKVLVDPPAQERWFAIQGAAERELAPNETDQIAVKANLPADAQPGKYNLRLLVFSAARGDAGENFTEGPTVSVEMPAPEAPVKKPDDAKKPFPWWIVAVAAAVLLLVGGLVVWLLVPKGGVTVPEVAKKMTIEDARKALQEAGLGVIKEETTESGEVAPGFVLKQDPQAGAQVAKDTPVTLWVAQAPAEVAVPVPNVKGLRLEVAEQQLTGAGLKAVKKEPAVATLEFKPGEVTRQVPEAFSKAKPGDAVALWVAGDSVKIPAVKGNPLPSALTKMSAAKLLVKVTGDQDKLNQGVVSTTPPEGQVVLAGSEVTIHMPGNPLAIIQKLQLQRFQLQQLQRVPTK
jgi:beta-lactam-binding protein with PASTA domain